MNGRNQLTRLQAGEVHLWRAPLDLDDEMLALVGASLSPGERERAQRFHREPDRRWFVASRGWLRLLLSQYLEIEPAEAVVVADDNGKPRLEPSQDALLRFNLAHSGPLVAFAVAQDREVGVDIEMINRDVEAEAIAERFMSVRQHRRLTELPDAARAAVFFDMWTRNEAYVKGIGTGLLGGPHDFDATPGWSVSSFDVGPGYAAAVAIAGSEAAAPQTAQELRLP